MSLTIFKVLAIFRASVFIGWLAYTLTHLDELIKDEDEL